MKKIFLVDDSHYLVENMIRIVASVPGLIFVGAEGSIIKAVEKINQYKPDIVILDIGLEDGCGIDIIEIIKKKLPSVIIIVFTNYNNDFLKNKSLSIGADYFLDKTAQVDKLFDLLKQPAV